MHPAPRILPPPARIAAGAAALAVLLVALCASLAPSGASASSIVYIKGGNVWQSSPDGSVNRQLTRGGNWHSPTQADDGTIAAVQGFIAPITVMDGYGREIRKIQTPTDAATSNGGVFPANPVNLSFAPDGSKIGYEYSFYTCPPAAPCGTRSSTFYTHADRSTPVSAFGNQFNLSNPSMLNDGRALAFGGYGRNVNIDVLGGGDDSASLWFNDGDVYENATDLGDGELSRDGTRLAALRDYGPDTYMLVYEVTGNPFSSIPPVPEPACETDSDPDFNDPSFSPDGRQLAFGVGEGVSIADLPTVKAGDCTGASVVDAVLPGASEPDWGPANVKAGNPPDDPDPVDPDKPSAAGKKAKEKLARAKAKLKKAKKAGKKAAVKKAKGKVGKAKQGVTRVC